MATFPISQAIQHLRAAPPPRKLEGIGDGVLLERFIGRQDESAFEELVRRHSSMVLGVCQRVLHNPHDAEDCFQAVFMVLVRKATSIQPREMVGNWLYGVAYRTALEARKMAARRRVMERKKQEMPARESVHQRWHELRPVLDQELSRLPDKYRVVLIACDLEGKTRHEAARSLRLPEGTVASRLARARALLAKRLARHSVSMSIETLALVLAHKADTACVPASLLTATVSAASRLAAGKSAVGFVSPRVIALAESVVKNMLLAKLKIATAALLLLAVLGIGVGAFIPAANADKNGDVKKPGVPQRVEPVSPDLDKSSDDEIAGAVVAYNDESVTIESSAGPHAGYIKKTYGLEKNANIRIDGKKAKLSDLKIKMLVSLQMAGAKPGVVVVEAAGPKVRGILKAVDAKRKALAMRIDDTHLVAEGITVTDDAPIVIDGKKGKLADLRAGMRVTLRMSADADQSVIVGINTTAIKQD